MKVIKRVMYQGLLARFQDAVRRVLIASCDVNFIFNCKNMPKKTTNESVDKTKKRGCTCKGNCASKSCGCFKKATKCTNELCKCNSICTNQSSKNKQHVDSNTSNAAPKDTKSESAEEKKKPSKSVASSSASIKLTLNEADQTSKKSNTRSIFSPKDLSRTRSQKKKKFQAQAEKAKTARANKITAKDKLKQFKNPNEDDSPSTIMNETEKHVKMKMVQRILSKTVPENSRGLRRSRSANYPYQIAYNTRSNTSFKLNTFPALKLRLNGDEENAQLSSKKSPMKRNSRQTGRILRKAVSTSDLTQASKKEPKNVTFRAQNELLKQTPSKKISRNSRGLRRSNSANDLAQGGPITRSMKNLGLRRSKSVNSLAQGESITRSMKNLQPETKKKRSVSKARPRRNLSKSPNPKGSNKPNGTQLREKKYPNKSEKPVSTSRSRRNQSKSPNPKGSKKANGTQLREKKSADKSEKSVSTSRSRRNQSKSPNPKGSNKPNGTQLREKKSADKSEKSVSTSRSRRNQSKTPNPKGSKKATGTQLREKKSADKSEKSVSTSRSRRNQSKTPNPKGSKKPNVTPLREKKSPNKKEKPVSTSRSRRNPSKTPNPKGSKKPSGSPLRKDISKDEKEESTFSSKSRNEMHIPSTSDPPKSNKMDFLTVLQIKDILPESDDSESEEELSISLVENVQKRRPPRLKKSLSMNDADQLWKSSTAPRKTTKQRLGESEAVLSTSRGHQNLTGEYSSDEHGNPGTSKPRLKRKRQAGASIKKGNKENIAKFTSPPSRVNLDSNDDEICSPILFVEKPGMGILNSTEKVAIDFDSSDSVSRSKYRKGRKNVGKNNLSQQAEL